MRKYIIKRLLTMVVTLLIITLAVFFIIQLPPGDYVDTLVTQMIAEGDVVTTEEIASLKAAYGLDKPFILQYFQWLKGLFTGDWGLSYFYHEPVLDVIRDTLGATLAISFLSLVFTYLISIPIAIYSAKHQYSFGDYLFTSIGFIGISAPGFLVAIILIYLSFKWTGKPIMGLPALHTIHDLASFGNYLKHLLIPILVIGLNGTCALIRSVRAQMLDEQEKPYITSTRAKGVSEKTLTFKYEMKAVLNPIISELPKTIAHIFNGSTIIAIVLMLPTQGPVLLKALQTQDIYLSGGILLISAFLIVLGTLLSDILLSLIDPRIKLDEGGKNNG